MGNNDPKQGWLANSSGNTLEKTVLAVLQSKGFEIVQFKHLSKLPNLHDRDLVTCPQ